MTCDANENEQPRRREKVWMQTRLWFIQHHQLRRSGSQESSNPQQVPQGAVRELRSIKRSEQTALFHFERKASVHTIDPKSAARKGVFDSSRKSLIVANLLNRLNSRS